MAMHHARWRTLTGAETATAVASLRELAGGRADLLAEQAGLSIGHSKDTASEPLGRCAAELLIRAGARPGPCAAVDRGWPQTARTATHVSEPAIWSRTASAGVL
ncbi:MAG: hypothetical protein ACM3ML_21415 [Micromonosporaceae bacterium]